MTQGIHRARLRSEREFQRLAGDVTHKAVYALLSQGAALAATMTPVDTGFLINSQYAPQIRQSSGRTVGDVGYLAHYAPFVHDAPGTLRGLPRPQNRGFYWSPAGEPGFLEKAMQEIERNGTSIIRRHYRV